MGTKSKKADPSYGKEGEKVALNRSIDLAEFTFLRLPGTEEEAKAIKNLLPQAIVLTGSQATENALKQALKPNILHIATHDFFKPEKPKNNSEGANIMPRQIDDNPLLRSGGSRVATVYQLLGDTYLEIGLPQLAKKPYEKALKLATGTENLSVQAGDTSRVRKSLL